MSREPWIGALDVLQALSVFSPEGIEDRLNFSRVAGQAGSALLADRVGTAAGVGLSLELRIEDGPWILTVGAQPGRSVRCEDNGLALQVFREPELSNLAGAIEEGNLEAALRISGQRVASFDVSYQNAAADYHWIRTSEALLSILSSPTRIYGAERLLDPPAKVMVADLGSDAVTTRSAAIYGPDYTGPLRPGLVGVPGVLGLAPEPASQDGTIVEALRKVTLERIWADLGTEVINRGAEVPLVRIEGTRTVEVPLEATATADQLDAAIALWQWANATTELDRREAIQQASSLAILGSEDLSRAAVRALPTARSVYQLARKGLIVEVLSAKRAARDAAFTAARAAVAAASDAATKARDRLILQLAGSVALAIGRATEALTPGVTRGLLALLLVAVAAITWFALFADFPAAELLVSSFAKDLENYSDVLSSEDVADIVNSESLRGLTMLIEKSKTAVVVMTGLTALGIIVIAVVV